MSTVSRFAPSPTGQLHLGHAYSAVRAHDLARAAGGQFLLRIEDIDGTRSREDHVAAIEADLRWLGLAWDGPVIRQSARMAVYAAALERLKAAGLVYPCFCTRAEIAASATAPHGDEGPLYPGTCRLLSEEERHKQIDRPHCWRLDMARAIQAAHDLPLCFGGGGRGVELIHERLAEDDGPNPTPPLKERGFLTWHDASAGLVAADPLSHGDIVLARKETPTSYHLAVVVDDAAQGVTDVVRGVDLFAATHVHRLLQTLLGLPTPSYHHHPLLIGPDGKRLAKRNGAAPLALLRAQGADPGRLLDQLRAGELPIGDVAGNP